jgi:hypothetical protein
LLTRDLLRKRFATDPFRFAADAAALAKFYFEACIISYSAEYVQRCPDDLRTDALTG